ncbi:MAG TPA: hypothetical protein VL485_01180 [Ktedonobacteraceae bacterium]|jgi:hypothetical protein|nr:hypothetical protein [Ktedonobacteraceae bacterium]
MSELQREEPGSVTLAYMDYLNQATFLDTLEVILASSDLSVKRDESKVEDILEKLAAQGIWPELDPFWLTIALAFDSTPIATRVLNKIGENLCNEIKSSKAKKKKNKPAEASERKPQRIEITITIADCKLSLEKTFRLDSVDGDFKLLYEVFQTLEKQLPEGPHQ